MLKAAMVKMCFAVLRFLLGGSFLITRGALVPMLELRLPPAWHWSSGKCKCVHT